MKSPQSSGKQKKSRLVLMRRVVGGSMEPSLRSGQLVLAHRPWRIAIGDVVIVHHRGTEKLKRIERLERGQVYLLGDNLSQSTDSRSFGWLPQHVIIGKVIWPKT